MKNIVNVFLISIFISSCAAQKSISLTDRSQLKFIGEYRVAHNKIFEYTTIGGLSGIDYDRKNDVYYLICDDRSSINPARFYTARIHLNEKGIDSVEFLSVRSLLQQNGQPYPNSSKDPFHAPDPESVRYNPKMNQLVWSSEGERIVKGDTIVLQDPFIHTTTTNGKFVNSFALPENMRMQPTQKGPRQNGVFEGLVFSTIIGVWWLV